MKKDLFSKYAKTYKREHESREVHYLTQITGIKMTYLMKPLISYSEKADANGSIAPLRLMEGMEATRASLLHTMANQGNPYHSTRARNIQRAHRLSMSDARTVIIQARNSPFHLLELQRAPGSMRTPAMVQAGQLLKSHIQLLESQMRVLLQPLAGLVPQLENLTDSLSHDSESACRPTAIHPRAIWTRVVKVSWRKTQRARTATIERVQLHQSRHVPKRHLGDVVNSGSLVHLVLSV